MTNKTLVFSIALNGYQLMYQKELSSHERYAKSHGYDYQNVTRPSFSALGVECCWLKLTLMRSALVGGYDTVMFIDADATVKDNCPALESVFIEHKLLYMAKGYSKRFNSGVLIARNSPQITEWLTRVINSRMQPIMDKNSVGWGENGHIIELSNDCDFIGEIDQRWNNTYDYQLNDFIQHKNCGPLRKGLLDNFLHKIIFCLSYRVLKFINNFSFLQERLTPENVLENETSKIIKLYPYFLSNKTN